jgi:threonine/homoserine/homoserine lactone efflux protein
MIMLEPFIALVTTTALLLGSPGPATISLAAAGAGFGIYKSLPYLAGILAGLTIAILGAAFGLATLFEQYPSSKLIMQILGGSYLIYVAYKIASAPVISANGSQVKTPNFMDGFILNLLNVKAYAAFVAIFSQLLLPLDKPVMAYLMTSLSCLSVALIVDSLWLLFGGVIKPWFSEPQLARRLRISFALLMLLALVVSYL